MAVVVSLGRLRRTAPMSSTPTTLMSSGTRTPRAYRPSISPSATWSLQASTAVVAEASTRSAAASPARAR